MDLCYDRQLTIAVGASRKATQWNNTTMTLGEFYERFRTPLRGTETLPAYLGMKKAQQDELKDVGGYVGGSLSGPRRKAANVIGRDMVTLDFDNIPPYGTDKLIAQVEALGGVSCCIYSTRKHRPEAPRLRVVIPTDRTMTVEEYEATARMLAGWIGISWADPTTFEACRLMYWASCCADGEYIYKVTDGPLVSVDTVLGYYTDWHDTTLWPQVPGAVSLPKLAAKQGDPEAKTGIVGAFCRTYDVISAMEKFLPGVYEPVDNDPNRFTYVGGSTTGGAVIYDNGKFLYSHHATDPCSGKLVNAFDLVRLHRFGDLDDEALPDTPLIRLPSFKAMCDEAAADPAVSGLVLQERAAQAAEEFAAVAGPNATPVPVADDEDESWMSLLSIDQRTSNPFPTINNIRVILEHESVLKGRFGFNEFANRGEVWAPLPWDASDTRRAWSDTDTNGLYWFLETKYRITKRPSIDSALDLHMTAHSFNEIHDYLNTLTWDGTPRLETLLIEYLGAEDDELRVTRTLTRKIFIAAVARAMAPGVKFDNMLIMCGPQGVGKSTVLSRMGRKQWFTDNVSTFEGKEAAEVIQGKWVIEVAELDAFNKSDISRIKQFLSAEKDRFREAYGRRVQEFKRRCVFFGTCNEYEIIRDQTGGRRFWPVDVGVQPHRDAYMELTDDIVDQVWAEALVYWRMGESLEPPKEIQAAILERQNAHRVTSPREGMVLEFVARQVPKDWQKWPLDRRRDFWSGGVPTEGLELVDRPHISAIEVWCELFNGAPRDADKDSKFINGVLGRMPGWKRAQLRAGPAYGSVRGFVRKEIYDA